MCRRRTLAPQSHGGRDTGALTVYCVITCVTGGLMRLAPAELSDQSSRRTTAAPEILSFCCSAMDCVPLERLCSTHPLRDRQELFPGKHDGPLTVSAREHRRFPATDSSQRTRRIRSQHTHHRSVHRVYPTTHGTQASRLSCPALPAAGQDGAHSQAAISQPSR